jgi:ATP-binding cassette subfamily B protein
LSDDASDDHFEPEDTVDEANTFDGRLIRRLARYLKPYARTTYPA